MLGWCSRGDGQDNSQSYTQGYSKYPRRPRVRTARLASLLGSPLWSGWRGIFFLDHQTAPILPVTPWWWTHVIRHRLAAALPPGSRGSPTE